MSLPRIPRECDREEVMPLCLTLSRMRMFRLAKYPRVESNTESVAGKQLRFDGVGPCVSSKRHHSGRRTRLQCLCSWGFRSKGLQTVNVCRKLFDRQRSGGLDESKWLPRLTEVSCTGSHSRAHHMRCFRSTPQLNQFSSHDGVKAASAHGLYRFT